MTTALRPYQLILEWGALERPISLHVALTLKVSHLLFIGWDTQWASRLVSSGRIKLLAGRKRELMKHWGTAGTCQFVCLSFSAAISKLTIKNVFFSFRSHHYDRFRVELLYDLVYVKFSSPPRTCLARSTTTWLIEQSSVWRATDEDSSHSLKQTMAMSKVVIFLTSLTEMRSRKQNNNEWMREEAKQDGIWMTTKSVQSWHESRLCQGFLQYWSETKRERRNCIDE